MLKQLFAAYPKPRGRDIFLGFHTSPLPRSILVQPSPVCFLSSPTSLLTTGMFVFSLEAGPSMLTSLLGSSYDGCPAATRDHTITCGLGIAAFRVPPIIATSPLGKKDEGDLRLYVVIVIRNAIGFETTIYVAIGI